VGTAPLAKHGLACYRICSPLLNCIADLCVVDLGAACLVLPPYRAVLRLVVVRILHARATVGIRMKAGWI
jgi:hypothetical protein